MQKEFGVRFQRFTGGLFEGMDWANIVCAGGAVLACLLGETGSSIEFSVLSLLSESAAFAGADVDLFVYDATGGDAFAVVTRILQTIAKKVGISSRALMLNVSLLKRRCDNYATCE